MDKERQTRLIETSVGAMNYHVLRSIIEEYDVLKLDAGVEVGVLYGDTSVHLLRSFPELTLFGVDPYLPYGEEDRKAETMLKFELLANHRLREFGDRSVMMKMTSLEAAERLPDASLDFVFLDGLHTYEGVRDDILAWAPKLRNGGLLCGHDISWEGVRRAVAELTEATGCIVNHTGISSDLWFTFKCGTEAAEFPIPKSQTLRNAAVEDLTKIYGVRL